MSNEVHVCPNCGAYVMGGDDICPRCDQPLERSPRTRHRPDEVDDIPAQDAPADPGQQPPDRHTVPTTELPPVPDRAEAAPPGDLPGSTPEDAPEDMPGEPDQRDEGPEIDLAEDFDDDLDIPPPDHPERQELRHGLAQAAAALDAPLADPDAPRPLPEVAPSLPEVVPAMPEPDAPPPVPEDAASEQPTAPFDSDSGRPGEEVTVTSAGGPPEAEVTAVQATPRRAPASAPAGGAVSIIPPAPYTPPPPAQLTPPAYPPGQAGYAAQPALAQASAYLQQRVAAYQRGGYRLHVAGPYEAMLTRGKRLGVGGWILALVTLVGFGWYLLLLAVTGFQAEPAYLVVEADGRVYEDGPGAAHVRQARARAGRRWSVFGLVILVICLVLAVILGAVAGVVLTQERYQAAVREAYPAVTLFEEHFSATEADPDDVSLAKDGAVVFAILAGIAGVGLWGGATLLVIGTIHAGAYRVAVPPLPGFA